MDTIILEWGQHVPYITVMAPKGPYKWLYYDYDRQLGWGRILMVVGWTTIRLHWNDTDYFNAIYKDNSLITWYDYFSHKWGNKK